MMNCRAAAQSMIFSILECQKEIVFTDVLLEYEYFGPRS